MRSRRRRASLVGFAGAAAALAIGSYAWACTPNAGSHSGLNWICKNQASTTCAYNGLAGSSDGRNVNPTHNLSFYSQAVTLTANGSYNMKYVVGVHNEDTDFACNNGTTFNGGANIVANAAGGWTGKGPLTIPNVTGVHTVCTAPLDGNDSRNFLVSKHILWNFM